MTFHGIVERADLQQVLKLLNCGPDDLLRRRTFVDLSRLSDADLVFLDMLGFAERLQENRPFPHARPLRIAIFAPSNLAYGLGRMTQQLLDSLPGVDVSVTHHREAALRFLCLTALPVDLRHED